MAAPARTRLLRSLPNARNLVTPCNGEVTVIVMTKIIFVDADGMEEIAADRKEIFSIALVVYAKIPNIKKLSTNKKSI